MVYSKAIGSLLTLLLTSSYAYFMLEQYKEAARVSEMGVLFFQKNKKYFTAAIIDQSTSVLSERLSCLLCLSYIMLEEKPKAMILELFKGTSLKKEKNQKEKLVDKYLKLKQGDVGTFAKLFDICSFVCIRD